MKKVEEILLIRIKYKDEIYFNIFDSDFFCSILFRTNESAEIY
jgi:hypothetical protein